MNINARRITVGLVATAVVATTTSVTTWAAADEKSDKQVRLVVGYKAGADPATTVRTMAAAGARNLASGAGKLALDELRAASVQVPASRSAALMASLRSDPNVAYVEVDKRRTKSDVTPDDVYYPQQPEMAEVSLPAAWDTTTGTTVKVAVIDTGVAPVEDLSGAVLPGYDVVNNDYDAWDDEGHGTFVASIIAARSNNQDGMAGVCWQCQILPVKVLDFEGGGWDSDIAKGITWAVQNGAKVLNLSLGGPGSSKVLSDAVAYAVASGVLVVAAAGNENTTERSYPAAYPYTLAVGGTDPGGSNRAYFSNYNSSTDRWVDVAAPAYVTGMTPGGSYLVGEAGTSFSTPLVAGTAALIKSHRPSYTGWSLLNAIQSSATPIDSKWATFGKLDAAKALTIGTDTTAPTSTGISPAQNAKLRGTITVTPLKAADNWSGIRNVQLYVDGAYKGFSRTAPFSVKWNSAGRNGAVKLQLRVYDYAGNGKILDRTIIADNTAPTVKITKAPKNKSKIKGTVKISYTGSDKYGVKNYQFLVNGKVVSTHVSTKHPFSLKASKYPKTMTVQIRATDNAGNVKLSTKYTYYR